MAIALRLGDDGNLKRFDASTPLEVPGDLQVTGSITGALAFAFNSEGDFGNSGTTPSISWTTLGQKVRITLNDNATFSFTFPGVGNYMLKIIQDGTGSRTVTLPASARAAGGSIDLAGAADAVTLWAIYWDGTNAFISSMPGTGTSAPTVNLT